MLKVGDRIENPDVGTSFEVLRGQARALRANARVRAACSLERKAAEGRAPARPSATVPRATERAARSGCRT
jgi:hypothetical protein